MNKKWLWLTVGVVVAVGLALQAGCVPSMSPEEKARREVRAAAQLIKQKEWLSEVQADGRKATSETGLKWSLDATFFQGSTPRVSVECEGLTKRQAKELCDGIAWRYLSAFPDADKIRVSVKDWDSLEQIYSDTYWRKPSTEE